MGKLYFGDNLDILRDKIETESIDLCYLDPPFSSNRSYNVLFKSKDDRDSSAQIKAFEDTWTWGEESARYFHQLKSRADAVSEVVQGLRESIGANNMMAYLVMMTIRLIELHRVLKPTGSLYLHCDPTASHYLKVILDAIFEPMNFKNEIIWKRSSGHPLSIKKFEAITDTLLFYCKSSECYFSSVTKPVNPQTIERDYRHTDEHGRYARKDLTGGKAGGKEAYLPFNGTLPPKGRAWAPPTRDKMAEWAQGKLPENYEELNQLEKCHVLDGLGLIYWSKNKKPYVKRYLPENPTRFVPNLWDDIKALSATSREKLNFETQKPIALLERILEASSKEGDVVLDPFCGCGTAVHAAQKMNRRWVGIDITHLAIGLIEYRMTEAFGIRPPVEGIPTTLESAEDLARRDKYQFEAWAVTRIDGIRPNQKKGRDRGIDGRGYVRVGPDSGGHPKYEKIIVSVKGGERIGPAMVRDLKGTVDRESAGFGIFVCIKEPTQEMRREASSGGIFETPVGTRHPKIQIYTIRDYFEGRLPDLPQVSDIMQAPTPERKGVKSHFVSFNEFQ
ncbi:MAG: DNA methyltransferase [Thaumarchaeota archaeon]|nr:DNA methyltransferase [Nitrososphaerota archaeon]MDE0339081.1 DNA methyltransferase [Caldilineaceae bacterium]